MTTEPSIIGSVEAIFFQNPSNFYKVMLVNIEDQSIDFHENQIVVTGTFGDIHLDTSYLFYGNLVEHAKYGKQLAVTSYAQAAVSSSSGLIQYLSSDKFQGIGKAIATKLVDLFAEETIAKILADDPALKTITGLTTKKRQSLQAALQEAQGENQTIIGLLKYGFTDKLAYQIYQVYREQALKVIESNPYDLIEKIEGIGFRKADEIAQQLNIPPDARERLSGALLFTIKELCYASGNTYVEPIVLLEHTLQLLEQTQHYLIAEEQLTEALLHASHTGQIIEDSKRLAIPSLYYAENGIATALHALMKQTELTYTQDLDAVIAEAEDELEMTYSTTQRQAIKQALLSPVSILTGGPGTGKTTVLNGIVYIYAKLNDISLQMYDYTSDNPFPILLAAPTGRAAKRMKEMTGLPAVTLHRLLGIGLTGKEVTSDSHINEELTGSLLIVDEMSMVDTWLLNWLLKAVPAGMQVLFVGDKDQLPSVGPGQVLHDLLLAKQVPATELKEVYRQNSQSTIPLLAQSIKDGVLPDDFTQQFADRSFFECGVQDIVPVVQRVVERAKAKGFTMKDIQVLAPMYKGVAGINRLNTLIQSILNPNVDGSRREVTHFETIFRVGDKVLQLVNQPEQNVFNGDIGEIVALFFAQETDDKVDTLVVSFDGNEVVYKRSEWINLTLAYCCSIHKAQGSEFPLVILPLVKQYGRMLKRAILYTGLTRSKQSLVMCGQYDAFAYATSQAVVYRQTMLVEKMTGHAEQTIDAQVPKQQQVEQFILTPDNYQQIDPMIGMTDVSPYAI